MAEINRFPGRAEGGFGEKRGGPQEFHMPHPHGLTGFQKLINVVELLGVCFMLYVSIKAIINFSVHIAHVLH